MGTKDQVKLNPRRKKAPTMVEGDEAGHTKEQRMGDVKEKIIRFIT